MAPLTCFARADTLKAGLLGKLFGRKPKENCFIEIQNLLAAHSVSDLAAADVENVLSEYQIPRSEASPRLMDLYRTALLHLAEDGALSEIERNAMKQLRFVLGLDDLESQQAETEALRERYREHLQKALRDSHLSEVEKAALAATAKSFGFSEELQQEVYKEEVLRVVQQAFDAAVSDKRLTQDEDKRLTDLAANLGVNLRHDPDTQRLVDRFRLLARIDDGDIPEIRVPVLLQRGEKCYAQFASRLHEKRSMTKRIHYSGPSGSIRIVKGLRWRYGSVTVHRVTSEELRHIDSGTLYITNKRLLFNGASKNLNVPFKKIIHFTLYRDGLQIEKEAGRDQYFLGEGDLELIGIILESALRAVRP
jgi:hypothetical protein